MATYYVVLKYGPHSESWRCMLALCSFDGLLTCVVRVECCTRLWGRNMAIVGIECGSCLSVIYVAMGYLLMRPRCHYGDYGYFFFAKPKGSNKIHTERISIIIISGRVEKDTTSEGQGKYPVNKIVN